MKILTALFEHRYGRILKFLVSGGSAAVVDLGLLYALTDVFHVWYLLSAVLAFLAAFGVSFSLQKFWTFNSQSLELLQRQLVMYLVLALFGLGLNTIAMYFLVDHAGFHYLAAQILTSAVIAGVNYFAYKHFIFAETKIPLPAKDVVVLSSISFFCPAYNDAGNLPDLIPVVVKFLQEHSKQFEIIIIEDGSPDKTGEVADLLATQFPNVRVIHHAQNMGYTATLKEGFEAGKYEYLMYTDGDNQYDVMDFVPHLHLLNDHDLIAGYAIKKAVSPRRRFQSWVHNMFVTLLFGTHFRDINCSMKLMKRSVIDAMTINSNPYGAFVDSEIMIKAKRLGFRIAQFPVVHYARKSGLASGSKPALIFATIRDTIKLRFDIP